MKMSEHTSETLLLFQNYVITSPLFLHTFIFIGKKDGGGLTLSLMVSFSYQTNIHSKLSISLFYLTTLLSDFFPIKLLCICACLCVIWSLSLLSFSTNFS